MQFKIISDSIVQCIETTEFFPISHPRYIEWLSKKGNIPAPADPVDPNLDTLSKISSLESTHMLPRITREFMISYVESKYNSEQLEVNVGYQKLKALDLEIKTLRGNLK